MPVEEGELRACLALDDAEPAYPLPRLLRCRQPVKRVLWMLTGVTALASASLAVRWLQEHITGALDQQQGGGEFVELQAEDACTEYFSIGKDCSSKNLWECAWDDNSLAFGCCCKHGFGDFSRDNGRASGTINWAENPKKCIDLSMPYVGTGIPFTDGNAMLANCNWGNPNKMFHLPLAGTGRIHWATHPTYCLGVKGGQNVPGNTLNLQRCLASPPTWTTWTLSNEGSDNTLKIRWAAFPNVCLQVGGETDGAPIQLGPCVEWVPTQRFRVTVPPPPPPFADVPSLFCIALMMPRSYEVGMMKDQLNLKMGIAECNEYAVYSNESVALVPGVSADIMPGSLKVEFGGQWHTALNTDVFIRFWEKVCSDPRTWRNQWTIKVDPDCVFYPSRLREVMRNRWYSGDPKQAVYLNNCHNGMHGPIEVVSQQGLRVYKERWMECKNGEPYLHKQEDFYFRRCWALLGISKVDVYNLLFENLYACDERSTTRDGRHPCFSRQVAFHPFKTVEGYRQCHRRGKSMQWTTPMHVYDEEPSSENHHHS